MKYLDLKKPLLNIRTDCSSSEINVTTPSSNRKALALNLKPTFSESRLLCFNSSMKRSTVVVQSYLLLHNSSSDAFQQELDQHQ